MVSKKSADFSGFDRAAVRFLVELTENNDRDWFKENQDRYETLVREPTLAFIRAMAPRIRKVSPHFVADDKKVGGSMMRPQRDTRFGADKTPYKTNVGIQFRHESGKDVHAPGMYVHFDPAEVFVAVGLWHPEPAALASIRAHLDENQATWKKAVTGAAFTEFHSLQGDSLKRPPKGYPVGHPYIEDLKRKDFIAIASLDLPSLFKPTFPAEVESRLKAATPLLRFLCEAIHLPF